MGQNPFFRLLASFECPFCVEKYGRLPSNGCRAYFLHDLELLGPQGEAMNAPSPLWLCRQGRGQEHMWDLTKAANTCLDKVAWHQSYMRSTRVFGLPLVLNTCTWPDSATLPLLGCYQSLATSVEIAWDQQFNDRAMDWNLRVASADVIFGQIPEEDLRPLFKCLSCDVTQSSPRFVEVLSDLPSPPVGLDSPISVCCHDYLIVRQGKIRPGESYDRIRFTTPG